ncbi:DUF6119 family protein [Roseococcus sp. YIM B11640]|uniref:DUF6119 family protein n=1 Tax=Roseococcus sp. YIM B11640 TaxID=3133973 RepID=UPI003C7DD5B1
MSEIKKVTLYKIKPGNTFADYIKGDLKTFDNVKDPAGKYEAYIKYENVLGAQKNEDKVPWLRFLNGGFPAKKYLFDTRNRFPRAIMALKVNAGTTEHHFAIIFGQHADTFLNKKIIAHDFGIKVGMNICGPDGLRRIQTAMHEAVSRQTERQASVGASLTVFGMSESEFLKTISGDVDPAYKALIESFRGRDNISIKLPKGSAISWSDLSDICLKFEERYNSSDYKATEFRVYDILRHENDPIVISELDKLLCSKIEKKDFSKIHLSPPVFMEEDEVSYAYKIKKPDEDLEVFDDLSIEDLINQPRRRLKGLTQQTIENWHIYRYDSDLEATFPLWDAYRCIVAEIELGKKLYVLANGQWREVSEDLLQKVDSYFQENNLVIDPKYLPQDISIYDSARNENREEVYNTAVAVNDASSFLFDKSKILIAGKNIYEICDLMHLDKHLVHVKKYSSGAASISHLFVQTKFYSHAFSTEEDTRKSMIDWIDQCVLPANSTKDKVKFKSIIPVKTKDLDDRQYTVIFCVLHSDAKFGVDDLPFMSRYELMSCHKYLTQDRRFQVGVAFRKVILGKPVP